MPDAAGQAAPSSDDGSQPPDSNQHDADNGNDPQTPDDHGDPAIRKARREASALRKRLRATEAERDQLRERIDAMIQHGIDNAVQAAGYGSELADLIDTDALMDDNGALDRHKLQEAITSTAAKYNIARKGRAPEPNRQQGAYGPPRRQPDAEFRAAFAPRQR